MVSLRNIKVLAISLLTIFCTGCHLYWNPSRKQFEISAVEIRFPPERSILQSALTMCATLVIIWLLFKLTEGPKTSWQGFLRNARRSGSDEKLGGVCGGLAEITDTPSWVWRVAFVLLAVNVGVGVGLYVILWICLPTPTD